MPELPEPNIVCKFRYGGFARYVENVTFEWERRCLIGFERRKAGKFSNGIKRYRMDRLEGEIEVWAKP